MLYAMSAGSRKEDAKALIATSPMKILGVDNLDDAAMMVRLSPCSHKNIMLCHHHVIYFPVV